MDATRRLIGGCGGGGWEGGDKGGGGGGGGGGGNLGSHRPLRHSSRSLSGLGRRPGTGQAGSASSWSLPMSAFNGLGEDRSHSRRCRREAKSGPGRRAGGAAGSDRVPPLEEAATRVTAAAESFCILKRTLRNIWKRLQRSRRIVRAYVRQHPVRRDRTFLDEG